MKSFIKNPPLRIGKSSIFKIFAKEQTEIDGYCCANVGLGYAISAPYGDYIQVFPDPEPALKGLHVFPAVMQPDPAVEIKLMVINITNAPSVIEAGDCLGQLVFIKMKPNFNLIPLSRKNIPGDDGDSEKTNGKANAEPPQTPRVRVKIQKRMQQTDEDAAAMFPDAFENA